MKKYLVTIEGAYREEYLIEAESPEEAQREWSVGELQRDWGSDFGVVSVEEFLDD